VITKIGVVIVAYDSGDLLQKSVSSVNEAAKKSNFLVEICVIDNHPDTKDSKIASIVSFYSPSKSNIGFGSGCNIGIRKCLEEYDSDYILLLNPDARLNEDFFFELDKILGKNQSPIRSPISPMILLDEKLKVCNLGKVLDIKDEELATLVHGHKFMKIFDSEGTLVSDNSNSHVRVKGNFWAAIRDFPAEAKVVISDSISSEGPIRVLVVKEEKFSYGYLINNAGSYLNPPFIAGDISFQNLYIPERWNSNETRSVWCGACVLLHKEYFSEVGYFDEDFFLYYEDIEFSLRGLKKGLYTDFEPNLLCFHGHSKSTSKDLSNRSYHVWRSRALFTRKVYGFRFALLFVMKLIRGFIRPNLSRSHLRHIRHNLLPELKATLRGILGVK
jgi:GT2 family glycosyltransferase